MSDGILSFIYKDARGNVTARELTNVSVTDLYIQGICLKAQDLRTFRKDRILEYTDSSTDVESRLQIHISQNPKPSTISNQRMNMEGNPEVCFTGFKKDDKDRLTKLTESVGLFIRTSVTVNLDFLCCGYNAGPKKIEKSRHQGVVVLSESQFISMLETGEIPEEV